MRLILMLLVAGCGYHFVSNALDDRNPTTAASESKVSSGGTSVESMLNWVDAAKTFLAGAKSQASSIADEATSALPRETQSRLSHATQTASDKLHLRGAGCGEPDATGNLRYCFNDQR
ncbi:hypothetical protein LA345_39750 (plasmid) [Burkholderia vietnamiensis]|nr:hypothetical protein [Burkholderia vietnamiensis]